MIKMIRLLRRSARVFLPVLLAGVFSTGLLAQTSVWQITKDNQTLYLAGTVHLLPPAEFPLPEPFLKAYAQAEKIVFEADVRQLSQPEGMQVLMRHARYQDGKTLQQVLSEDTYQVLQQQAALLGVDVAPLAQFKPDFVLLTLMQVAMQRAGLAGEGVDMFFMQRASKDNKAILFLETIEQQLSLLMNVSTGHEDTFVAQNLQQLDKLEQEFTRIVSAWREGDTEEMSKLAMAFTDTPQGQHFYDTLLVQRNHNWLPEITQLMATPETELVLVGALHLAGDSSLLHLLQQRGYSVKQL